MYLLLLQLRGVLRSNEKSCVCNVFATPHSKNPVKSSVPSYLTLIIRFWNVQFQKNLQEIRYRNGKIVDYTSRLHYSSDWLYEMTCLNLLEDITKEKGGIPFPNKVSFISQNWKKYPALIHDSTLVTKIIDIEKTINGRTYYYIPKEKVLPFAGQIKTGDIILITTKKKGLDTAHVGISI